MTDKNSDGKIHSSDLRFSWSVPFRPVRLADVRSFLPSKPTTKNPKPLVHTIEHGNGSRTKILFSADGNPVSSVYVDVNGQQHQSFPMQESGPGLAL